MKLTGGFHRGRAVVTSSSSRIRPTSGKVREAIFNMLGPIENFCFLDLFAGSGSVGFEALSRGASKAYFIDHEVSLLKKNAHLFSREQCIIIRGSLPQALARIRPPCNVIYLDPPFSQTRVLNETLTVLRAQRHLFLDSTIVVVQKNIYDKGFESRGFVVFKQKKYGDSEILFLTKEED